MHQKTGVQLDGVTLLRGRTTVFSQLHLQLTEQRIGLIGHNGVGKTSLFRLICGLDQPHTGQVWVAGQAVGHASQSRPLAGMMFQNPDEQIIFPTVQEELALGLQALGQSRREALANTQAWLAQRGLSHWGERAIGSLSQGQRQHVCWLAMLLAANPVMLLDEPYASLDLPSQMRLRQEIDQSPHQVLVSTHALEHVRHFERVIWLDDQGVRLDGPGHEVCDAYRTHTLQSNTSPTF
ncbi:MAG: ABC transporter ATP-binding protein [Betaproteobacteria bacterium]|nr:ABC transporter ATP-binding protein [Betaproteobacteria bacterium]